MYPEQKPFLDLRKRRDFGQIFNDAFAYVKHNFKSLLLCMLLLPTPLLLIAGGFYGHMQSIGMNTNSMFRSMQYGSNPMDMVMEMFQSMIPYYFFLWLGSLVSMATVFRFIIIQQERRENNTVTVNDIVKHLPGDVWRLFYNGLLLGLITMLFIVPFVLLASASLPLVVFAMFLLIIGLLLCGPQLAYALNTAYYLVVKEKLLITSAFGKAWRMMSGNFWWTWVIMFVGMLIVGLIGAIFALPMSIAAAVGMITRTISEHEGGFSILFIVLGMIATVGPHLISPISYMFSILSYHNYEEEKNGSGLKSRIDEITPEN